MSARLHLQSWGCCLQCQGHNLGLYPCRMHVHLCILTTTETFCHQIWCVCASSPGSVLWEKLGLLNLKGQSCKESVIRPLENGCGSAIRVHTPQKYCLALRKCATLCDFILHPATRFTHPFCVVPEKKHWQLFRSFRPAWSCGWQRWTVWSQVSRRWIRCTACKPCLWMLPLTRPTPCTPSVIGKPSYLSVSELSVVLGQPATAVKVNIVFPYTVTVDCSSVYHF